MVETLTDPRTGGRGAAQDVPAGQSNPAPAPAGGKPPDPIIDVWSRTQPKYRIRAIALLIVNFALFCGLCIFTHWLHVARPFDFSQSSYADPLRFWGVQTQNLNDFLLYPISVEQTPAHGIVLGLLLASIIAVPITISILYRFWCALPFLLAILVFAHLPWMAFTLLTSCILASVQPFRMKFRFGSALVGLLPMLAYLYLATRGGDPLTGGSASPTQESVLASTWALSILAACGMVAAILLSARLVNYRPEAVSPIIAVMFATPVILFHAKVGADELAYRVLETEHGPRSARLNPGRSAVARIRELMHRWTTESLTDERQNADLLDIWTGQFGPVKRRVQRQLLVEFLADRATAYEACNRFTADYAGSRYTPAVLYIKARTLDTRLDERALSEAMRRDLYNDFPHVQSEDHWTALWNRYPESSLSLAAGLRLAQLRLRRGDAAGALELLNAVRTRGKSSSEQFTPTAAEKSLEFDPQPYWLEARRLYDLVAANSNDPKYGNKPLQELASLDPHRPRYGEQLDRLADAYPNSLLRDNLMVLRTGMIQNPEARAAQLKILLRDLPEGDARAEALFRLADLETQALAGKDEAQRAAGLAQLREIAAQYGATYWGEAAAERLQLLEPPSSRAPEGTVRP